MAQTRSIRVSHAAAEELAKRAKADQRTMRVVLDRLLGVGEVKTTERKSVVETEKDAEVSWDTVPVSKLHKGRG
jgi:hypothetical protein